MLASGAACSSSTKGDSPAGDESTGAPFEGLWSVTSEGQTFDVNVESDKATIVRFGPGFQIGNPEVINGGDLFLKDMTRVDSKTFRGQVAAIVFGDSPTFPKSWPASTKYVDVTIQWDEATSKWTISAPKVELGKQSKAFDGKYDPAGACEKKFVNNTNNTLYLCEYPQADDGCSSGGEKAFWPSTDCTHLGYTAVSKDALAQGAWQHSATSNGTPGEHGKWGDGTGGGKIVSAAAAAAGSSGGGGGGGGGGAGCLSGTWKTPTCGSAKLQQLKFDATTGSYSNPDCNDICTDLIFPFNYKVSGNSVTLAYTEPPQPSCPSIDNPPKLQKPADDTFTFTCESGKLVTTTAKGTTTYTR